MGLIPIFRTSFVIENANIVIYTHYSIMFPAASPTSAEVRKNLKFILGWTSQYKIKDLSLLLFCCDFKGIVHPKMKILSSCICPQDGPNLYEFFSSSVEHKIRYFEECW